MPKKHPATLSAIYHMPKEDLRPRPLTPYGVWDDPAMHLDYVPGRNTPAYYAAMYLLTANEIIYWRMANCFCRNGLDFRYAILRGITTYNYALYRAALALTTDRQPNLRRKPFSHYNSEDKGGHSDDSDALRCKECTSCGI